MTFANVHLAGGQLLNRRQLARIAGALRGKPSAIIGDYNIVGPVILPGFRDVGPREPTRAMPATSCRSGSTAAWRTGSPAAPPTRWPSAHPTTGRSGWSWRFAEGWGLEDGPAGAAREHRWIRRDRLGRLCR